MGRWRSGDICGKSGVVSGQSGARSRGSSGQRGIGSGQSGGSSGQIRDSCGKSRGSSGVRSGQSGDSKVQSQQSVEFQIGSGLRHGRATELGLPNKQDGGYEKILSEGVRRKPPVAEAVQLNNPLKYSSKTSLLDNRSRKSKCVYVCQTEGATDKPQCGDGTCQKYDHTVPKVGTVGSKESREYRGKDFNNFPTKLVYFDGKIEVCVDLDRTVNCLTVLTELSKCKTKSGVS